MDNKELHAYCEQWVRWCETRKFFIAPGAKNFLARMIPSKIGLPPNAIMSADMCFFNMALHALADMEGEQAGLECFIIFYWERAKDIKAVAGKMGIHRDTFYDRKNKFARRALSMATSLKKVHQSFQLPEKKEVAAID